MEATYTLIGLAIALGMLTLDATIRIAYHWHADRQAQKIHYPSYVDL